MNIRKAELRDIPRLVELERAATEASHWSEEHYREAIHSQVGAERLLLVAENRQPDGAGDSRLVGFLVARNLAPEWELENIVVAAAERRRGIGAQLLNALLDGARETNSTCVFLEVRESNVSARALYKQAGFRQNGRRKSYYGTPPEDAILYRFDVV